ncbi:MAG: LysE family translocator [Arenibacterium sp.]
MSFETWSLYVLTVLALMATPGPSQLLMLANSARHGAQRALATAAGDLTANLGQMLAAGLGLAALIAASGYALTIIKWAGVAYLIWLGLHTIRNAGARASDSGSMSPSLTALWTQGFLTSAANPKAVVFFAALFPQFISPDLAFWPQFWLLAAIYIAMDGLFLSAYGFGGAALATRLRGQARQWLDRVGGALMIAAAMVLGSKSLDLNTN